MCGCGLAVAHSYSANHIRYNWLEEPVEDMVGNFVAVCKIFY